MSPAQVVAHPAGQRFQGARIQFLGPGTGLPVRIEDNITHVQSSLAPLGRAHRNPSINASGASTTRRSESGRMAVGMP